MANFHRNAEPFVNQMVFNTDDIILEIGSDRGEGSTAWFDQIAERFNTKLYSIDVSPSAKENLQHLSNTVFVVSESGSKWVHEELPILDKKIKILYLDNYDWLSSMNNLRSDELKRIEEYRSRGVEMTNLDCQREHLHQMVGCLPFMHKDSIIICDDTPYQDHSGIYIGKNGAVIPYLLSYDYKIVFGRGFQRDCHEDNGLILARGNL
jgi:hypothetical protein